MKRRTFVRSSLATALATPFAGRDPLAGLFRVVSGAPGDVEAVRGDGTRVVLKEAGIKELARSLGGHLLLADSAGYDTARQVLNPTIDRHPALIAQPASDAEVQRAVRYAREHGLLTAVKCGGHSTSGQSTCDGGLMIDLGGLRGVRIDAGARRARVAGGSLLGALDREALNHGLVTPMGTVSHTGVGGLTTGGGFGRVARRFGLALDNVTSVDVVVADGRLLHANAEENPDLYWGVRGGGGNFGVVTTFEFQLHPMQRQVMAGSIVYPIARAAELLRLYADVAHTAPDDLYVDFAMMSPPGGGDGVTMLSVCYSGPAAGADKALAPLRKLGSPLNDGIAAVDYVEYQKSGDIADPRAMGTYLKGGFSAELSEGMMAAIIEGFEPHPARVTLFATQHCGGAISRVPVQATAFAHRDAQINALVIANWPAAADPRPHMGWARRYWAAIEKYTRGFYINEISNESAAQIDANYGANYPRLVELKNKYDPTNLFRLNANVRPTV